LSNYKNEINFLKIQFSGGKDDLQQRRKSDAAGRLAAERQKRVDIRKGKRVNPEDLFRMDKERKKTTGGFCGNPPRSGGPVSRAADTYRKRGYKNPYPGRFKRGRIGSRRGNPEGRNMIIDLNKVKVFLRPGTTDLRKAANGLSIIVQEAMKHNPFNGSVYLFCNRERKLLKAVYWDKTGFWLSQKRLEKDKFPWPQDEKEAVELTIGELKMLLAGIDFFKAHKEVIFKNVA